MRGLKILTITMAVMIVAGVVVVGVTILQRLNGSPGGPAMSVSVLLDEPEGSHIAGIAGTQNRLAVWVQGAGPDRLVLLDAQTGRVVGRAALSR